MKGVKCTISQKLCTILVVLFALLFTVLNTVDVFAIDGTVAKIYYRVYSTSEQNPQWSNELDVGPYGTADTVLINYGGGVRLVRPFLPSTTWSGNQLITHWEINLVCGTQTNTECIWFPADQVGSMDVVNLRVGETVYPMQSATWSYAITPWYRSQSETFRYMSTLTLYIDVIADVGNARTGSININFGNPDLLFFLNHDANSGSQIFYVEKVTASVNSTDTTSNSLSQTQINQNNTIINQNQQVIDQDNSDRNDLQNTSNSAESDADQAASAITSGSTSLLSVISNFVYTTTHPPSSDCTVNMNLLFNPFHTGNYGSVNLCSLDVPPAFSIIGTLIIVGFTIPFAYSLIMTILSILKGATDN